MKKTVLLFSLLLSLVFVGCTPYFTGIYGYGLKNESSVDTTVFCTDGRIFELKSGESIQFDMNYKDSVSLETTDRIKMTSKRFNKLDEVSELYTIIDKSFKYYEVYNLATFPIILVDKEGLIGDNYNDVYLLPSETSTKIKVYEGCSLNFILVKADKKDVVVSNAFISIKLAE